MQRNVKSAVWNFKVPVVSASVIGLKFRKSDVLSSNVYNLHRYGALK